MEAQRFETRQTKSACDSRRSAGAADRAEHNLVLTSRLPAAVAIFDVIAGCDPADPVTAASQGKRADSYLRFLDTDGARLCVVHQLFTSEDADPGAMARIGPQRERFSPPRASGRCRFGEGTFASTPRERARCAESGHSGVTDRAWHQATGALWRTGRPACRGTAGPWCLTAADGGRARRSPAPVFRSRAAAAPALRRREDRKR